MQTATSSAACWRWAMALALVCAALPAMVVSSAAAFPVWPRPACPVSVPVADPPPGLAPTDPPTYFGDGSIWTTLWPGGRVVFEPGGPGFVLPDGALGMKWPVFPLDGDAPTVEGRRLDRPADPLRSSIRGKARSASGPPFYPVYLIFPTPGCWAVTIHAGDDEVTFVTRVVRVGDGPDWRPEAIP